MEGKTIIPENMTLRENICLESFIWCQHRDHVL